MFTFISTTVSLKLSLGLLLDFAVTGTSALLEVRLFKQHSVDLDGWLP